MNKVKNSRTTTNKKNAHGGSPLGRPQKENIYLKDDFTGYLQSKNLAPTSIETYLWNLKLFLAWVNKEEIQITKPDILKYLQHLKNERKQKNTSLSMLLNSLNHYFTFLYKQEQISTNPCSFLKIRGTEQKSLYRIYTSEELSALYDNFYLLFVRNYDDSHVPKSTSRQARLCKERNAVILNILINQGLTSKEIDTIQLCDLDLMNATLKIGGARKKSERILPLEATQIGVLMNYLQNIRPNFLEYQENQDCGQLFLSLPESSKKQTDSHTVMRIFSHLKTQIKSIDKHFVNINQIRASVITNWLKIYGLRKTQYLAGHRYIGSTEQYLVNDLQQLTDDISKLHPF